MAYDPSSVDIGESTKKSAYDQLLANDADIKTTTLAGLKTAIFEIGDWDMDTDTSKNVAHGLGADYVKIKTVSCMIRNDDASKLWPLDAISGAGGGVGGGIYEISSTNVSLYRYASAPFDNSNFGTTPYNRGWVTVMYEE